MIDLPGPRASQATGAACEQVGGAEEEDGQATQGRAILILICQYTDTTDTDTDTDIDIYLVTN